MRIGGEAMCKTYFESSSQAVGAKWWRYTSTRSQTTARWNEASKGSIWSWSCAADRLFGTGNALSRWSSLYLESMHPRKDPRAALQLPGWMRNAGFTEVESRLLTLPMCGWSNGTG